MAYERELDGDITASMVAGALYTALAIGIARGQTSRIDARLRRMQPHARSGPVRLAAKGVKEAGRPQYQLSLAALMTLALHRAGVRGSSAVITATAAAFLMDKASKRLVQRRRPPTFRGSRRQESFPSGHTTATAALTVSVARLLERQSVIRPPVGMLLSALCIATVGEARLRLDEHWPSDVLAGALLGSAVASATVGLTAPRVTG